MIELIHWLEMGATGITHTNTEVLPRLTTTNENKSDSLKICETFHRLILVIISGSLCYDIAMIFVKVLYKLHKLWHKVECIKLRFNLGNFCVWSIARSIKQANKQTNKHQYTNRQNRVTVFTRRRSHLDRIKRMADSHATNSAKSSSKEISHARYTPSLLFTASGIYLNSARTCCSPLHISAFHLPVVQSCMLLVRDGSLKDNHTTRTDLHVPIEAH